MVARSGKTKKPSEILFRKTVKNVESDRGVLDMKKEWSRAGKKHSVECSVICATCSVFSSAEAVRQKGLTFASGQNKF